MPVLISMSMSSEWRPASARQARAASSASRRADTFRPPLLISALAAAIRVPIAVRQTATRAEPVHLAVDREDGHADLDAGGERQQHHPVALAHPMLPQVLVQRHEQRGGGRVAVFLHV